MEVYVIIALHNRCGDSTDAVAEVRVTTDFDKCHDIVAELEDADHDVTVEYAKYWSE